MKRRLALLFVSVLAVGSLQIAVAPMASASEMCADPNCPWSPVTEFARRVVDRVDQICDENTTTGCPL